MDFSSYSQHLDLTRANAQRLEREIELRRRNAETRDARAAAACDPVPGAAPAPVIRRAWRLATSHAACTSAPAAPSAP